MKNAVISQPRYLPVINYLQRLKFADIFVILDNVQRQGRGWENRNKLILNNKIKWLTMPISSSSREMIRHTKINGKTWIRTHKDIIRNSYFGHPHYNETLLNLYYEGAEKTMEESDNSFTDVVIRLILNACTIFGFRPTLVRSSLYPETDKVKGHAKLAKICDGVGASTYISGANGKEYGIMNSFGKTETKVLFHYYDYPVYEQSGRETFTPWLAFFDPLFNLGLKKTKEWIYEEPYLTKP
jgi:hypothetical protein